MNDTAITGLAAWVTDAGLAGKSETAILDGFCRGAAEAGLPIARAMLVIDTLHPVYEGRVFRWRGDAPEGGTQLIEYGPSTEGEVADAWRRSVFFYMVEQGISLVRLRFMDGDPADFGTFEVARDEGMTDVVALITRFAAPGVIGEMDCVYSSWATDAPRGFDDAQVEALSGLMPKLALAVKCVQPRVDRPRRKRSVFGVAWNVCLIHL